MKKESGKMVKPAKKMAKAPMKHDDAKQDKKMIKGMVRSKCMK